MSKRKDPAARVIVEFLHDDPFRGGGWYRHRDGESVHEYVLGGHLWRGATPMSSVCILCNVLYQNLPDPSWEKCPRRPAPHCMPSRPKPLRE